MTAEQKRILVVLLRDYARQTADKRAMTAMLQEAQDSQEPIQNWVRNLEVLRRTPEYRAVYAEFSALLDQIEATADQDEIEELMRQFPPNGLVN